MLLERLQRNPLVTIVFGAKVTELQQTEDEVIAKATFSDRAPETFRADFCIGADGIGSIARQTIGAEFAGRTIPEIFLTISTTFDFSEIMPDLSNIAYISDPTQWYVLIRTAKVWRALFPVNPELNDDAVTDPEAARQLLQTVWRKSEPYEVSHRTGYRVHERVASYYTRGRIAIAGDAAHVNNPLGGMGLNGGIHDAFNLSSAIEAFFNKEPGDVLGRYERQRRKVALDVVQQTTLRNRAILNTQDPAARTAYYDELRRTVANEATHKEYLMRTSMISSLRDVAKID
jgi:3-(3-hydroxy-phenyl)propionate hydroxylase